MKQWDHNGGMMVLHRQPIWKRHFTFVPAKMINAFPDIDWENQKVVSCHGPACANGCWAPGDFICHFAGGHDKTLAMLKSFLRESWPGGKESMHYPGLAVPMTELTR